jgi:hypothetical protein
MLKLLLYDLDMVHHSVKKRLVILPLTFIKCYACIDVVSHCFESLIIILGACYTQEHCTVAFSTLGEI